MNIKHLGTFVKTAAVAKCAEKCAGRRVRATATAAPDGTYGVAEYADLSDAETAEMARRGADIFVQERIRIHNKWRAESEKSRKAGTFDSVESVLGVGSVAKMADAPPDVARAMMATYAVEMAKQEKKAAAYAALPANVKKVADNKP